MRSARKGDARHPNHGKRSRLPPRMPEPDERFLAILENVFDLIVELDPNGLRPLYFSPSHHRVLGYQPHDTLFEEALKHHVFLSPSVHSSDGDTEGGAPVALIDLSATGMPVVSTVHCDIPNVILDEQSGLLAAERDVEGLVDRLKWLIDHPERWEAMALAGRQHIEAEFDAAAQGRRLAEHYQRLLP